MAMSRGHSRGPGSVGSSRSSLNGVGFLPVIAEDEIVQSLPSPTKPYGLVTPVPLHIPRKNPRRGSPVLQPGLPPPYVPPYIQEVPTLYHPPPSYKEEGWKSDERESQISEESEGRRRLADRWCCILGVLVLVLVILAVGLATGLTIGLKDRHKPENSPENNESSSQNFPAGSFSFEVDLQETSTNCTSNPSTWRCYPYTVGNSATFFWIISIKDQNSSSFTISSTDNPFAPSFSDQPLSLLDKGKSTERLHFSFTMTKTVVPSGKLASDNRAAQCTFAGTVFEATLWTRRRGNSTIDEVEGGGAKFGAWPRNVQIVQSKKSQSGQPKCEDSDGNVIGNVQAQPGTCECRYASDFDE